MSAALAYSPTLAAEHTSSPAGVTYAEVRAWAVWLSVFTASDLADAMAVDIAVAERGLRALLWHGICEDTGDQIDGPYGAERIIRWLPLPPGPRDHPSRTPEWQRWPCGSDIVSPRGLPVRLAQEDRRRLSMPGERHRMRLREKRYEEMEAAKARRRAQQTAKATDEPQWKRKGRGKTVEVKVT